MTKCDNVARGMPLNNSNIHHKLIMLNISSKTNISFNICPHFLYQCRYMCVTVLKGFNPHLIMRFVNTLVVMRRAISLRPISYFVTTLLPKSSHETQSIMTMFYTDFCSVFQERWILPTPNLNFKESISLMGRMTK